MNPKKEHRYFKESVSLNKKSNPEDDTRLAKMQLGMMDW